MSIGWTPLSKVSHSTIGTSPHSPFCWAEDTWPPAFLVRRLCGALKANYREWPTVGGGGNFCLLFPKHRSDLVYSSYFNAMAHLGRKKRSLPLRDESKEGVIVQSPVWPGSLAQEFPWGAGASHWAAERPEKREAWPELGKRSTVTKLAENFARN